MFSFYHLFLAPVVRVFTSPKKTKGGIIMNKLENYRPCAEIKPVTAKLLLLMLRDITDDRDQITIPQRRIAEAIGMSRSAVGRNLRRLERAGAIAIEPLYSEYGGRLPNRYRLGGKQNGR